MFYTEPGGRGALGGGATMKRMVVAAVDDVDELIEQYYRAQREFLRGNPEPVKDLFSHTEDVTLANPYGPPVRGFDEVAKAMEHAASLRSDGTFLGWQIVAKYVTAELAYVVQIERAEDVLRPTPILQSAHRQAGRPSSPSEEQPGFSLAHPHTDALSPLSLCPLWQAHNS
jgi:hypothetical protein